MRTKHRLGKSFRFHLITLRKNERAFHAVLKLARIPSPFVFKEELHHIHRNLLHWDAQPFRMLLNEMFYEDRNILFSLAERRKVYRYNIESIEEIFAEATILYIRFKIP